MNEIQIPVDSCFFAQLPMPTGSSRERQQELMYAFEGLLPLPVEQCQMSFANTEGYTIGCACRKSELAILRAKAERAIPSDLPAWLNTDSPEQIRASLNLLKGDMQSFTRLKRRRKTLQITSISILVFTILLWLALHERARVMKASTDRIRADISSMYSAVLPPAQGGAQPDAIRFMTYMNQLTSTRTGKVQKAEEHIIAELATLLSGWPSELQAQVKLVTLSRSAATLQMDLPNNTLAADLLKHFRIHNHSWDIQSHETTPHTNGVSLNIQLSYAPTEANDA